MSDPEQDDKPVERNVAENDMMATTDAAKLKIDPESLKTTEEDLLAERRVEPGLDHSRDEGSDNDLTQRLPIADSENKDEPEVDTPPTADENFKIDFSAPADLRKWPSVKNERLTSSRYPASYVIVNGNLDECIRQFMSKPESQHHLYEIHTATQSNLINAVLSAEHIVELGRLRDFSN